MSAGLMGSLILLVYLYVWFLASRYPHTRRMALRNLFSNKNRFLLTITGAMVGTALITSSLLLTNSITVSVNRIYEEQFGPIVSDLPAVGQVKLNGRPYFTISDVEQINEKIQQGTYPELGSSLPAVGYETILMKLDDSGNPILLNPNTYVNSFALEEARKFDPIGSLNISPDLQEDEIIISDQVAEQLEVEAGDMIAAFDSQAQKRILKVRKVTPTQGIADYRGIQKAKASAIVTLQTARKLAGVAENCFTNILFSMNPERQKLFEGHSGAFFVRMGDGWKEVNVRAEAETDLNNSFKFLPIFTIVSINAVIIGMSLIINIFKMIAEERRQEMGILRALGMNRKDLSKLLLLEGANYAAISGVLGLTMGIGIAYLLLIQLRDVFADVMEYMSGIEITYSFYVDPKPLILGFSIGTLLVFLCIWFVARSASRIQIVEAMQAAEGVRDIRRLPKRNSIWRTAVSLFLAVLTIGFLLITLTESFRDKLEDSPIFPLLIFGIGFLLLILCIVVVVSSLHQFSAMLEKGLLTIPRLAGTLRLAFRYPEVNRVRNGMLIFMFAAVFFLISFSGVVNQSVAKYFGGWDSREATGGYDLTAAARRPLATQELQNILDSSGYVKKEHLDAFASVQQFPVYFEVAFPNGDSTVEKTDQMLNGIDDKFASSTNLHLLERDSSFTSDHAAWKAVAEDPTFLILAQNMNGLYGSKRFKVGDMYPITNGTNKFEKRIIGIAESKNQSYGFPNARGIWIKQSEISSIAQDAREVQSTLLFRASSSAHLKELAHGIEKGLTLQNIYPLLNPQEIFLTSTSFYRIFFTLFEVFTALATVIGIAGLMVVMFRAVLERRQQIGMLRAIGVSPGTIYWSILLEGALIGIIGITIGLLIGSYSGSLLLQTLFMDATNTGTEPLVVITFPYVKLLLYFGGAMMITLFCAAIPARKTLRLTPAEATRYIG